MVSPAYYQPKILKPFESMVSFIVTPHVSIFSIGKEISEYLNCLVMTKKRSSYKEIFTLKFENEDH